MNEHKHKLNWENERCREGRKINTCEGYGCIVVTNLSLPLSPPPQKYRYSYTVLLLFIMFCTWSFSSLFFVFLSSPSFFCNQEAKKMLFILTVKYSSQRCGMLFFLIEGYADSVKNDHILIFSIYSSEKGLYSFYN